MSEELSIRAATPEDRAAIREVNLQAFRTPEEGTFEKLLSREDTVALVAVLADGTVAGHVIFTPAVIDAVSGPVAGMGLGELAVRPEIQRRGIGAQLANAGLAVLDAAGCPFCIVVGHATYYPRFGFERGSLRGLTCQWPRVPDASFMVRTGDAALMQGVKGVARFVGIR